jgi:hypothetical protein
VLCAFVSHCAAAVECYGGFVTGESADCVWSNHCCRQRRRDGMRRPGAARDAAATAAADGCVGDRAGMLMSLSDEVVIDVRVLGEHNSDSE